MTAQFDGTATDPANGPPNTRVRPQHIADSELLHGHVARYCPQTCSAGETGHSYQRARAGASAESWKPYVRPAVSVMSACIPENTLLTLSIPLAAL